MLDIVITGTSIIDGTGTAAFAGDVGITGDRIGEIGTPGTLQGRRVITAEGCVTCPGFVDIHSHSDYHLLLQPTADSAIRQGVTLEVGGNCGYAAAPIWGDWKEERAAAYRELYGLDLSWNGVGDYLRRVESARPAVNFALLMGHNTLRGSAMGGAARQPSATEMETMGEAARRGMREGALGLSTGLIYAPACFSEPPELIALAETVREEGGILTCHMRSEGDTLLEAIREILAVARAARIPLQISHLKTSGERNWGKLPEALRLFEEARAKGLEVTADRYPYTASNTGLQAVLPSWALEGDLGERLQRLRDPEVRRKIMSEIAGRRWDQILIAEVTQEKNRQFEGMRVASAAELVRTDPAEFILDLLIDEETRVDAIFFTMSEENLRTILAQPYVFIGSDSGCRSHTGSLARGTPHPRTFGTFARILGPYTREEKLFDLVTAIRKMTGDPCRKLGLFDRGRTAPHCAADLVLFDPATVTDTATYANPFRYPEGIRYVLVNGVVTIEEGEPTGERAGRALRKG